MGKDEEDAVCFRGKLQLQEIFRFYVFQVLFYPLSKNRKIIVGRN